MEEKENLPPLPANHVARENALGEVLWESEEGPYTADQMREYGALCARMAREEVSAIPSAAQWLEDNRCAASKEWIEGWTACRTVVTQRLTHSG